MQRMLIDFFHPDEKEELITEEIEINLHDNEEQQHLMEIPRDKMSLFDKTIN